MANNGDSLYRWERLTKPSSRVYSRSQRVTSDGDIQNWIQTVEDASTYAAASTFGLPVPASHKARNKKKIESAVADAHIHEAAYSEAQDLLNQWVSEKVFMDTAVEETEETWTRKTSADIRKEWRHLCGSDEEEEDPVRTPSPVAGATTDIYSILHEDDNKMVDSIIDKMLDKEVISKAFADDLGFDDNKKKKPDPRTKMQLRHQQVKENREKRLKEKEKKLQELKSKKESQYHARQMIMKEDQQKKLARKKEDEELQREIARVRRQMEEEKRAQEEERARERRERDLLALKAQQELERQQEVELRQQRRADQAAADKHRQVMLKVQEIEAREAANNLKILQRHFSAWYTAAVVEPRLALGRARATADWRLRLRAWNRWKAYVRDRTLDRDARRHEASVRHQHRQELAAVQHHRHRLLRRCLTAWTLFVSQQRAERSLQQGQATTHAKMAAFLSGLQQKAVATGGKRGQEEMEEEQEGRQKEVDALFTSPPAGGRRDLGTVSARSSAPPTSRSQYRAKERAARATPTPTQPWQVTKQHLKLTKKQLSSLGNGGGDAPGDAEAQAGDEEQQENSRGKDSKPWQKAPFVADGFANRHQAQQKLLQQQQKQIAEQQKLIEQLTYLQRQQMLQQQLLTTQTQQLQQHTATGAGAAGESPSKLQQHILSLQAELVDKNSALEQIQTQLDSTSNHDSGPSGGNTQRSEASSALTSQWTITDRSAVSSKASSTKPPASEGTSRPTSEASCTSSKQPSNKHEHFLKSMEARAAERARIKAERDERRRREEAARYEAALAEEQRRLEEAEEEKRRRAEEHRARRLREKQREQEKVEAAERHKAQLVEAAAHHRAALMRWRGWVPWTRLVSLARERRLKSEQHHSHTLLRRVLLVWHDTVQQEVQAKKDMAAQFYCYSLTRRCFANWRKCGEAASIQEARAARHYASRLLRQVVREWADAAADAKVAAWHQERVAREHNTWRIQMTCLRAWKRFPSFMRQEKLREKRMEEMRIKVAAMLPDFGVDKSQTQDKSVEVL